MKEKGKTRLKNNKEIKFDFLFNAMTEGAVLHEIIYDKSGKAVDYKILDVNPAFEKIIGIKKEKAVGSLASQLYGSGDAPYLDIYANVAKTGKPSSFETYFPPMDQHFNISVFSHEKGKFVTLFFDITESKNAEKKLLQSKVLLESSIESPKDMIILSLDRKYRYLYFNKTHAESMSHIYGTKPKIGDCIFDFMKGQDDIKQVKSHYDRALAGDGHTAIEEYGEEPARFYSEIRFNPICDKNEEIIGITSFAQNITERRQVETRLKESEKRSKAWLENSPVCTKIVDPNFNLQFMSASGIRDLKIDDITEYYGKPYPFHFYPDSFKIPMTHNLKKVKETGKTIEQEASVLDIEGNELWYHSTLVPVDDDKGQLDYIMIVSLETTERKIAEEKLREYSLNLEKMVTERTKDLQKSLIETEKAKDEIDGILKSVADGLIVTDTRHRILLMNHAAEDFLGVRLSNVIGRSIDFAIEEKTLRSKIKYTLNKKTTGYQFDFDWPGEDPKHQRTLRARTSVIHDKEGKDYGIVTIIHDVSAEREVDRMKTDFLSTAAHELRTPLTSIQGFSELLITRDDISEDEKSKFLKSINNQSVALAKIVTDLLDVTRIESRNGLALKKVHKDVKDTIKKIIPYFEGETQIHTFKLNLPKKPVNLYFDEDKTEQILKNIIGNSIKYSPKGGEIEIMVVPKEKGCVVSVTDQGIGMTAKQLEKIFNKFYRVDTSDTAPPGTGLGMVIVKHLVESHKGKIWVDSQLGIGTTVSFTLPLK